jgi:hypothetical protein
MPQSLGILSAALPTAGGGIARLALAHAARAGIDPVLIALAAGLTPELIKDARISVQRTPVVARSHHKVCRLRLFSDEHFCAARTLTEIKLIR